MHTNNDYYVNFLPDMLRNAFCPILSYLFSFLEVPDGSFSLGIVEVEGIIIVEIALKKLTVTIFKLRRKLTNHEFIPKLGVKTSFGWKSSTL